MKRSRVNKLVIGGGLSLLLLVAAFWWLHQPAPERLQGQIEAQSYSVSSKVPGRIDSIRVQRGDRVKQGDLIFTLHSPELDAKLIQAEAGQAAAGALAREVALGARAQQIAAAKDLWRKAQSGAELYGKTYQRVESLYRDGVVSLQKRDEAKTQWQAAKLSENAAWQQYQLALAGAREEQKQAAREKERMAAGAVAEVQAYAADLQVSSPSQGEVSQVLLQAGELAPQGFPVVTVTDLSDAWVLLHVREDLLSRFQPGREFMAQVPALGQELHNFRVTHVAVMGDFATWRATDSRQGFDMRTFEVEARPVTSLPGLRVGMSVLLELPAEGPDGH